MAGWRNMATTETTLKSNERCAQCGRTLYSGTKAYECPRGFITFSGTDYFCTKGCANAYYASKSGSGSSGGGSSSDDYEEQESEAVQLERAKASAARNKARLEEESNDYKLLQNLKFDGSAKEMQNDISAAWGIFEKGFRSSSWRTTIKECCNDNAKVAFEKVQFGIMRLHSADDHAGAKYWEDKIKEIEDGLKKAKKASDRYDRGLLIFYAAIIIGIIMGIRSCISCVSG